MLCVPFYTDILKMCTQKFRVNTVNIYCFIKAVLKWNTLFSPASVWLGIKWLLAQFAVSAFVGTKVPAILPPLLLHNQYKCQCNENKWIMSWYYYENSFDLEAFRKFSGNPRVSILWEPLSYPFLRYLLNPFLIFNSLVITA